MDPSPSEFVLAIACACAGLGMIDALLASFVLSGKQRTETMRFFILHAAVNWAVTAACTSSLMATLADPVRSNVATRHPPPALFDGSSPAGVPAFFQPNNHWPAILIACIHVYHLLPGLFTLTPSDYFHHLLFCPAIILTGVLLRCGVLRNAVGWFICGLPGAIDYTLLVMVKLGHLPKLRQKSVNRLVALWLRIPGLLFMAFCSYQSFLYDVEASMPARVGTLLCGGFIAFNGMYYGDMSIRNLAEWETRAQVESKQRRGEAYPVSVDSKKSD